MDKFQTFSFNHSFCSEGKSLLSSLSIDGGGGGGIYKLVTIKSSYQQVQYVLFNFPIWNNLKGIFIWYTVTDDEAELKKTRQKRLAGPGKHRETYLLFKIKISLYLLLFILSIQQLRAQRSVQAGGEPIVRLY